MLQRRHLIAAATAAVACSGVRAQAVRKARVIAGFPPGGTVDAVARRVADALRGDFAGVALVENKPGAGGRIAIEELKRSDADGGTLLVTPASMITLYPHLYARLGYASTDLAPVCRVVNVVFAFGVGPAVPPEVATLKQFLAWAAAHPAQAHFGSPGTGSPPHLLGALLSRNSGVAMHHVPFRGSAPGIQDLLGGQVSAFSSPVGDYLPHLSSGRLRVLATSGAARSRFVPEVPTFSEQGHAALQFSDWIGVFMPAHTAPSLVRQAAAAIHKAFGAAAVSDVMAAHGLEPALSSPAELAQAVKHESAAWRPLVTRLGFKPE